MRRDLSSVSGSRFDILVIGGGITGAAVAYEAASRGLKVVLFEKNDFGGATSAATSKMIHGGLRYLAKFEFGLVRESLRERRVMTNIAPNFVHPVPNMVISRDSDKVPGWFLRAGLFLYDLLSADQRKPKDPGKSMPSHRKIGKNEVQEKEPFVKRDGLKYGVIYTDCLSVSPERLTLAFLKSAVREGAVIVNYAQIIALNEINISNRHKVTGVNVKDRLNGLEFTVAADCIVNCTGPWVDEVLQSVGLNSGLNKIIRSEGIHLITRKLVSNHIVAATTPEGRHCFVVPWRYHSLFGTTDKEFTGDPDHYKVTKKAVEEFLSEINSVFGNADPLTIGDVKFAYGGLRPLVGEGNKSEVYKASRKFEIIDHAKKGTDGLVSVMGGKYTTSRYLAEKVVNLVAKKMRKKLRKSISARQKLYGCEINDFRDFIEKKKTTFPETGTEQLKFLAENYGTETDKILELAAKNPGLAVPLDADGEIPAQVIYAIREEMAMSLSDILFRRTGIGTLGNPGMKVLKKVAEIAGAELGWDEQRKEQEIGLVLEKFKING